MTKAAMTSPFDLTGKVAIVTGSSRGIGRATAELFGQLGASLVRVEVAVRALAHAPREMHVQRQRRQGGKVQWTGREIGAGGARSRGRGRGAGRDDGNQRSFSTSSRSAWPRCDSRFLSAAGSSAAVMPSSGSKKYGS